MARPLNVLFLCTGNSARSILAESLLNRLGAGRWRAWSAGSMPAGRVNPHALKLLDRLGYPLDGLRSKSWDEFAGADAPVFDLIITVCDNAAGEACPVWPGRPMRAHWGVPDPAAAEGSEARIDQAFADAWRRLGARIERLAALPDGELNAEALGARAREIGAACDAAEAAAAA